MKKYLSFFPAILVMILIFHFSGQTGEESGGLSRRVTTVILQTAEHILPTDRSPAEEEQLAGRLEFFVRKAAHFSEYLLLALTLFPPLTLWGERGKRRFLLVLLICFIYACTDEFHQSFVGGRSPQPRDVMIDTCGSAAGAAISAFVHRFHHSFIR